MFKIKKIFGKDKKIVIGAVHFPPLLGYRDFPDFEVAARNALADSSAFVKGGADGIIFENNYDNPHAVFVDAPVLASMTSLGAKLRLASSLPMGVNVLWNDFYASLSIAKALGLQFVRIPVFVDKIKTDCGIIEGKPKDITDFRDTALRAKNIALFTDIHVKHSKLLSKHNLIASAKLAIKHNSDALILTGNWTGQAPDIEQLALLRSKIGNFPILIGSGTDANNIAALFKYANGVIVSTSLKEGTAKSGEVNVKGYNQRISLSKVKKLIATYKASK